MFFHREGCPPARSRFEWAEADIHVGLDELDEALMTVEDCLNAVRVNLGMHFAALREPGDGRR